MPLPNNNDAAALLGEQEKSPLFIYRVYFDIIVSMEDEETPVLVSDSLDVDAGRDAREAQDKVEEFVLRSTKYKIPVTEFFISGCKRLAGTEI
jgi:hypothetical protein